MMRRLFLALSLALMTPSSMASAQETERELAVEMGRKGIELYNAQRFEDAFDKFQNAESLVHSPVFVLYMARIERRRGRWVAALTRYDSILGETPPQDAPPAWARARKEANLEHKQLAEMTPELAIDTGPAAPEQVKIWIDGRIVPDWPRQTLFVDPGRHAIAGQWGSYSAHAQVQAIARNKRVPVRLAFPAPLPPPVPNVPLPMVPMRPSADRGPNAQETASYVLAGVGGAAGLASLGVGIAALVHHGNFSDLCVDGRCPSALEEDVALHDRLSQATLGLGIGSVVLLAAGVIVNLTAPEDAGVSVETGGLTWRW